MKGVHELAEAIDRAEILFCTVVTRSHLNHAWCLRQSLRQHHPDAPFCILVVDALADDDLPEEQAFDCPLVRLDAFLTSKISDMAVYYTAYELCGNIKPYFLQYLFRETRAPKIIYLDSDLFITGPLWAAVGRLDSHDVTCAPHTLSPLPEDGREPSDLTIAANGAYNTGFMGFARTPAVLDLLAWMAERVYRRGFNAFARGMFCEQRFFNLGVTFLKERFSPLCEAGYNVGYWNLHERIIERRGGAYVANGRRMAFFHLSGFDPEVPDTLSVHDQRYTLLTHPQSQILQNVVADYRECFDAVPFTRHEGYRFDTYKGMALSPDMRRHYHEHGTLEGIVTLADALASALQCLEAGTPKRAAQAYAGILAKVPRNIDALYGYGLAIAQLGQSVQAHQAFHQVLALNPGHEGARRQLGLMPS